MDTPEYLVITTNEDYPMDVERFDNLNDALKYWEVEFKRARRGSVVYVLNCDFDPHVVHFGNVG